VGDTAWSQERSRTVGGAIAFTGGCRAGVVLALALRTRFRRIAGIRAADRFEHRAGAASDRARPGDRRDAGAGGRVVADAGVRRAGEARARGCGAILSGVDGRGRRCAGAATSAVIVAQGRTSGEEGAQCAQDEGAIRASHGQVDDIGQPRGAVARKAPSPESTRAHRGIRGVAGPRPPRRVALGGRGASRRDHGVAVGSVAAGSAGGGVAGAAGSVVAAADLREPAVAFGAADSPSADLFFGR
jgi:hypothetical protein